MNFDASRALKDLEGITEGQWSNLKHVVDQQFAYLQSKNTLSSKEIQRAFDCYPNSSKEHSRHETTVDVKFDSDKFMDLAKKCVKQCVTVTHH